MASRPSQFLRFLIAFLLFENILLCQAACKKYEFCFTGEDNGRLEPCGCASGQLGGLSRRNSFLKKNPNLFLMSNGDLVQGKSRQDELKFQTTLEAMNQMGYHVLNLGEKELSWDLNFLNSIRPATHFAWLAANIRDQAGQTPFQAVYSEKITEKNRTFEIKVIGILSPRFKDELNPAFQVLDPAEVLRSVFSENPDPNPLWILLYHGGEEETIPLQKIFPKIHLIITGHGIEEPSTQPLNAEQAHIMPLPKDGKYAAKISLIKLENQQYKFAPLEIICPEASAVLLLRQGGFLTRFTDARYIALDEKTGESQEMRGLIEQYQVRLQAEGLFQKVEGRLISPGGNFVGSLACAHCHASAFQIWKDSGHSHAYEMLVQKKRNFDPDCLACHTTGLKYVTGFRGKDLTPRLALVSCEACHGAAGEHVKNPLKKLLLHAGSGTCLGCHDGENSPHFDFDEYWKKIKHGKG